MKQENFNLKNKLENKRYIIEDIEDILDRKEEELKQVKIELKLKEN